MSEILEDKRGRKNIPVRRERLPRRTEFEDNESAAIMGEEQDAKDDTNHEDVRYPRRTRKPPKHLKDYVLGGHSKMLHTLLLQDAWSSSDI